MGRHRRGRPGARSPRGARKARAQALARWSMERAGLDRHSVRRRDGRAAGLRGPGVAERAPAPAAESPGDVPGAVDHRRPRRGVLAPRHAARTRRGSGPGDDENVAASAFGSRRIAEMSRGRASCAEADLYPAVKAFLEAQGYDVKAEVRGCDVAATRGERPPAIVELQVALRLG